MDYETILFPRIDFKISIIFFKIIPSNCEGHPASFLLINKEK
jgi:hypothetical protein